MNTKAGVLEDGFAAGPPQGKTLPPGGQRSTRSDERGGHIFTRGGRGDWH